MSYSIYIRQIERDQVEPYYENGELLEDGYEYNRVNEILSDDAPVFVHDELTKNSNNRHPSYTGWSDFTRACGLEFLFFDRDDGLMREHPGCFPINAGHLSRIKESRKETDEPKDHILARLIWLEFWFDYALKNCANPGIYNS